MNVEVNFLSVLLAAVASMVVGFLYYSEAVVGKSWMKAQGLTKADVEKGKKTMGPYYGLSFVLALISAYVLFHVMAMSENFYEYDRVMTGITSAFWMWLGFIMPVQATSEIFGKKKWNLFGINTGYQLVSLLTMGVVLGMM